MYYYLKWIVCGLLLFVNPLIAVILFIGWAAIDVFFGLKVHEENTKVEREQNLSNWEWSGHYGVFLEEASLSYPSMILSVRNVCLDYLGEPDETTMPETIEFLVRRSADKGLWERKLSGTIFSGSQAAVLKARQAYYKKGKWGGSKPWSDEEVVKNQVEIDAISKNEWLPIREDWVNTIEVQYQRYLRL